VPAGGDAIVSAQMNAQLKPDDMIDPNQVGIRDDSLHRFILDFEDLVDWAGDLNPPVPRPRDASDGSYFVALGLAALAVVAAAFLMDRRNR
jgi:hypothetical protein